MRNLILIITILITASCAITATENAVTQSPIPETPSPTAYSTAYYTPIPTATSTANQQNIRTPVGEEQGQTKLELEIQDVLVSSQTNEGNWGYAVGHPGPFWLYMNEKMVIKPFG